MKKEKLISDILRASKYISENGRRGTASFVNVPFSLFNEYSLKFRISEKDAIDELERYFLGKKMNEKESKRIKTFFDDKVNSL